MKFNLGIASAILSLAAVALGGCSTAVAPVGMAPGIQVASGDLPRPLPSDRLSDVEPFLVGAYDKLDVDVYGVPDLKRTVAVDANGTFDFPLIGEVQASGRSPREIDAEVTQKMRTYIKDPQVTVNVVERVSQAITIDGQVMRPGQYQLTGHQTLLRAIAVAGGASEYARLDDVVVFRTVDGQRYVGIYNLGAIRRGNYEDPQVFASDVVVVGDSKSRRLFKDLLQATPVLTAPLIILLQNL